ncbi:GvpL/GvpF family gas vesicle protein [Streptomyces avicenniae]|uniref:GvpL/GvpF family gas vesicle protein n=1 Tax=Streptomyces avicenniae TaxID=500153 RepID=UPI00069BEC40|nr:GvpL/GvpF family gas vesicle protein [Streptomyces avicenniae]
MSALYVYGVVRPGHPLPAGARGVGDPPARLRVVGDGALAAVVSKAPPDLLARRRDLVAHQETLLALAADGPVVPMRFGVVAPDRATLVDRLAASLDTHLRALERLDGRLEMNVKVFPVEAALAGLLRADATLRSLREQARRRPGYETSVRLGEAATDALRRLATTAAAPVLRALGAFAEAVSPGPEVPGCVGNTSFLVPRAAVADFGAEAARRTAEVAARAELRVTGPLPCFSFADTGTAAEAAPAPAGPPPATLAGRS